MGMKLLPFGNLKEKFFDKVNSEQWGEIEYIQHLEDQKINYFSDELFDDREYRLLKPNSLGYFILTSISPDDLKKPKKYSFKEIKDILLEKNVSVADDKIEKQLKYLELGGFVISETKELDVAKYGRVTYEEYQPTTNGIILSKMLTALNKMRTIKFVIRILLEDKEESKEEQNKIKRKKKEVKNG